MMEHPVETYEREGFTGKLYYDLGPESPREWDNCAILAQLLPPHEFTQIDNNDEARSLVHAWDRFNRDRKLVERYARIYLHAVAIEWYDDYRSTGRIVGIITRETAERELLPDPALTLHAEIETFAQWANGEVYGYIVTDSHGKNIDSCWGYYGGDNAMEEMRAVVDEEVAHLHAQRREMYRTLVNSR